MAAALILRALRGGWRTCGLILAGSICLTNADSAEPPAPTTKGFVITQLLPAMYEGKTGKSTVNWRESDGLPECPEGFALPPDTDAVLDELKVPAAEREWLKRPENGGEAGPLVARILHRGPQKRDVCFHPHTVPDPGFRTVKGKMAYGLDLDGSDGTTTPMYTCPHENFVGPNGERGIDNQLYRVLGCIMGRRQGGPLYDSDNASMRQGDFTVLIELTGVDDLKNDDEVRVGFYAGQDPMMNSVDDVSLTHTSLRIHHDRHYHAVTHGKIVGGVLTTEPVDVLFNSGRYHIRDARLRGEIRPDGSLKGMLGGYQSVADIFSETSTQSDVAETRTLGPLTCPGLYYALHRLADAYPDTPGGACKWISSAYEVQALPAFVIHPKDDQNLHAR